MLRENNLLTVTKWWDLHLIINLYYAQLLEVRLLSDQIKRDLTTWQVTSLATHL